MTELYPLLLMFSGLLLVVLAAMPWQTPGRRAISAIFGVGFLGYGFYLEFLFDGGTYIVFYYAFVAPILVIFQSVKGYQAWKARKAQWQQQPMLYPGAQYPVPPQYPVQPQYLQNPPQQ